MGFVSNTSVGETTSTTNIIFDCKVIIDKVKNVIRCSLDFQFILSKGRVLFSLFGNLYVAHVFARTTKSNISILNYDFILNCIFSHIMNEMK